MTNVYEEIDMKLRIIIADDDKIICDTLAKMISTFNLGLELVGIAHDGEELWGLIKINHPDIVITDLNIPKKDGLQVIRQVKSKGMDVQFVVISGDRLFDYAYSALKLGVSDYLLKPIERNDLYSAIKKIGEEIRYGNKTLNVTSAAFRQFFITNAISEITPSIELIEQINHTFGTYFSNGSFRTLFVKLDHSYDVQLANEIISVLQIRLESFVEECLKEKCNDILFDLKYDGVMVLI